MLKFGFNANPITYSCLFTAFARCQNTEFSLRAASHVYSDVLKDSSSHHGRLDPVVRQSFIQCLIVHKQTEMALSICELIQREHPELMTSYFYSNLMSINTHCPHSAFIYVLNCWRIMEHNKFLPNSSIFFHLLRSILKYQKVHSESLAILAGCTFKPSLLESSHVLTIGSNDSSIQSSLVDKLQTVSGRLEFVGGQDNIFGLISHYGVFPNVIILTILMELATLTHKVDVERVWGLMEKHGISPDIGFITAYSRYLLSANGNDLKSALASCLQLIENYNLTPNSFFLATFGKVCQSLDDLESLLAINNKYEIPIKHSLLMSVIYNTSEIGVCRAVLDLIRTEKMEVSTYMRAGFEALFDKLRMRSDVDRKEIQELRIVYRKYANENNTFNESTNVKHDVLDKRKSGLY